MLLSPNGMYVAAVVPSAAATRHYINRPLELLLVWHGEYEAWILEQAGLLTCYYLAPFAFSLQALRRS